MINKRDNDSEKFWVYAFLAIIIITVIWGILTVIAAFFAGIAEGARSWGETIALGIDRIFFGIFKGIEWLVYLISALLGIVIMWFVGAFSAHFRNVVQSRSNYLTSEQLRLSLESSKPEHIRFVVETSKLPQPLIKATVEAIDDFDDHIATHLEKFKKLMAEAVANKHHELPLAQKVRTLRDKITNDLQTFKLPDSIKRRAPRAYSYVLCTVTGEQIESLQYQPTIAALIPGKALELKQLPNTPLSNPKGSMMEKSMPCSAEWKILKNCWRNLAVLAIPVLALALQVLLQKRHVSFRWMISCRFWLNGLACLTSRRRTFTEFNLWLGYYPLMNSSKLLLIGSVKLSKSLIQNLAAPSKSSWII